MIKIGVVNIDTSHPKAFHAYLVQSGRGKYTAIYNDGFRGDDEVIAFMKTANMEKRCNSLEELAEIVDIGFIQGCNWDLHIKHAEAFFKLGKPVFIDKPLSGNITDCEKFLEYAAKGAVILGSSSLRYAEEIVEYIKIPVSKRGEIIQVIGTSGVDEFNYGIHIIEAICGLISQKPVSCRFVQRTVQNGKICETFSVRFEKGVSAIYSMTYGTWQPFTLTALTTVSTFQVTVDHTKIYGALLDRVCDYMETGTNNLASITELADSVKIALAGRISREKEGTEIYLKDIPKEDPGFGGAVFEKEYSASASKIYL